MLVCTERPGKGQDTGLEVRVSLRFLFLVGLFCFVARARGGFEREIGSEGYSRIWPRFACGLPWEVRFTILPLQRIDGHMQPIKTIDIGRHEQRAMYACISIRFARSFVCVVITHKKRTPILSLTILYDRVR